MQNIELNQISGFWRRFIAISLDLAILGTFGHLLGLLFFDFLVGLEKWGVLLGGFISLTYFGFLNSKKFNGQTLGKKLMSIKVVDATNNAISLQQSMFRWMILSLPLILGSTFANTLLSVPVFAQLIYGLIGALGTITVYFFAFNKTTRQTIHDMFIGSYVVQLDTPIQPVEQFWKPHFAIASVIAIATVVGPLLLLTYAFDISGPKLLAQLSTVTNVLEADPKISEVGIKYQKHLSVKKASGRKTTTVLTITALIRTNNIANKKEFAKGLAEKSLAAEPEFKNVDIVVVFVSYGFNIGIAKRYYNQFFKFKTSELTAQ